MCPEVLAGCISQVEELKSYPTSVTSAITLSSLSDQRRARNKETLTLFLPFWYEHILEHQRQDGPETVAEVLRIMTPRSLGPPGAPAAISAHPPQHLPYAFPQHLYGLRPPPYIPPSKLPPTLHPPGVLLPPGTTSTPSATQGFLGIPGSKLVCGADIGFDVPTGQRCCNCVISSRYTGSSHRLKILRFLFLLMASHALHNQST
jgi:hypothetical protein